jgi:malate synthase
VLDDGRKVTIELFQQILEGELRRATSSPGAFGERYDEAAWLLDRLVSDDSFVDFPTDPAYEFVAGLPEPVEAVA